jgi:DNA-binding IclR family transcriptional regulator
MTHTQVLQELKDLETLGLIKQEGTTGRYTLLPKPVHGAPQPNQGRDNV